MRFTWMFREPRITALVAVSALALLRPGSAAAQDGGKIGLAVRAPQSVGIIVHLSNSFALVPSIDLSRSSSRSNIHGANGDIPPGALTLEHSQASASLTLSARVRIASSGDTSAYLAPSIGWSVTSSEDSLVSTASTENDVAAGGHFGLQHSLSDRFSAFGEVGVRYRQYDINTTAGPSLTETTTYKSVNTSAAVGIVYYFKH